MYISTLSTRKKLPFSPSHDLHVELIPSLCLGMHCCDHPSAKWSKSNPKLECATSFLMPIPLIKRLLYRVTKFKLNFLKFLIKNLIFDNARCSNRSFLDFINNIVKSHNVSISIRISGIGIILKILAMENNTVSRFIRKCIVGLNNGLCAISVIFTNRAHSIDRKELSCLLKQDLKLEIS